jgi:hypothetical protein
MSRQRNVVTGVWRGLGAEIAMRFGLVVTELRGSTWLSLQLVSTTSYISIFPTRRRFMSAASKISPLHALIG